MKQLTVTFLITLLFSNSVMLSQNTTIDETLIEIEKNNTSLDALRKTTEAVKAGNKTNIYLQNPEIEFNYLWGNPSAIGNRTDIYIKQPFDFPSTYIHKNRIASIKNEQAELEYRRQYLKIMLEARFTCIEITYLNLLIFEYEKRLDHAQNIVISYQYKFDLGETGILELNKAKLNLLFAARKLEALKTNKKSLLYELERLNGGKAIEFNNLDFTVPGIPEEFDKWYQTVQESNPVLNILKREVDISEKNIKLSRAEYLPKLQTGYMSERFLGEQYKGVIFGLTIPLWENKNKIKVARLKSVAAESIKNDYSLKYYNNLKSTHSKIVALKRTLELHKKLANELDSKVLLKEALDTGEISLITYITELAFYYESVNIMLETKRDLHLLIAELYQYR